MNASQAMAAVTDPTVTGDAAAQAAAEAQQAAQLAAANAEAAQQAAQFSQQSIDLLAQGALTLDPATLAAMQALPVSGGLPATALQLDPTIAASLLQQGLQIPGFTVVDQNGNMQLMGAEGLQLAHGAEMYMTQQTGHEDYGKQWVFDHNAAAAAVTPVLLTWPFAFQLYTAGLLDCMLYTAALSSTLDDLLTHMRC